MTSMRFATQRHGGLQSHIHPSRLHQYGECEFNNRNSIVYYNSLSLFNVKKIFIKIS